MPRRYVKKGGHGGARAGAGRKTISKIDRLIYAGIISTKHKTLGSKLEDPEIDYQDVVTSLKALAKVPLKDRGKFPKNADDKSRRVWLKSLPTDAQDHLKWFEDAFDKKRVVRAERTTLRKVFATMEEESRRLGVTITARQFRRWYETLLPPRRGGKRET